MDSAHYELAPGSYSRYYLDSLAPVKIGELIDDAVFGRTAAALETMLIRIMEAQGHTVARVSTGLLSATRGESLAMPPFGWVMLRAHAVVVEFDVVIEDLDPLDDDPDEVFDVEVDVEVEILGPDPRGWWPNG